jgi:hypothetical protein
LVLAVAAVAASQFPPPERPLFGPEGVQPDGLPTVAALFLPGHKSVLMPRTPPVSGKRWRYFAAVKKTK